MIDVTLRRVVSGSAELAVLEAGDRRRPTVVLIHGYPDTKAMWDPVIGHLAGQLHVVAYDVRGAGASSAPRATAAYDFDRLGEDLSAVIAAVAPDRRAHLIGHDWGGLQGWEFATDPRFEGTLGSFTAIAGPSLDQVALGGAVLLRRRHLVQWLLRARRSWYIAVLLMPGGPTLSWRVLLAGGRWRSQLRRQGVPTDAGYPAPTLAHDGIHGAKLYRRNVPRRSVRPRLDANAHVPVQLIVPTDDRYIPESYYELAGRYAPALLRRGVAGSHWLPRTHPELVARWIASFVEAVESGQPIETPGS